jgi:general secretion pathway protein J
MRGREPINRRAGCAGSRHTAGFTLLEVLVAVVLLGLLSVALFAAVRVGARGWWTAEQRSAATEDATTLQDVLRRMIASAKPVFASADPADAAVAFDGTAQSLGLVGTLPDAIAPGLQGQQRLFLARHDGAAMLMLAWRLDLPAADGGTLPEIIVPLLDHVSAVRFEYYGTSGAGSASGWTDTWSGRTTLPALVRLHVERDAGASGPWPDLVAAPVATVSNECRYTGLDAACHRTP